MYFFQIFSHNFVAILFDIFNIGSKSYTSKNEGFHRNFNPLKYQEYILSSSYGLVNFIYSEKATKFCEIFPLLLTVCTVVKSKGKISQNFVAFSEYMNFTNSLRKTVNNQAKNNQGHMYLYIPFL